MFGEEAETLLETIRAAPLGEASLVAGESTHPRRAHPRDRQDRPGERGRRDRDRGRRHARLGRAADECTSAAARTAVDTGRRRRVARTRGRTASSRVESPMVGMFYRAPSPAPRRSSRSATLVGGQTLCLIEAMKLLNEFKAEHDGLVRAIHVENAQPVEYGQVLFELEPPHAPPTLDATDVRPRPRREPGRDRRAGDPRAHELGIEAVAVYSTADREALHVAARRPGRLHRAAAGGGELPRYPERHRGCGDDRLRRRASRATDSSPRTRRSCTRAATTTSSSSGRPPT